MTDPPAIPAGRDPVDRWLLRHTPLAVLVVMASGLAIRIAAIRGTYLGSDEALHFQLVNVSSVADVYRATLTNAHPPLFFFLLHFWRLVDSSEFFLRLLPALLGTAVLGVAYRWADRLFEKSAAFFTLTLLAFSPALVSLSAEVRGYTLLLFLMASALLVLERAIETRLAVSMACFSGLLYLAILTHYSALWFTLAAFAYVLIRIRGERPPARLIATWLGFQVGAAALYAFLYFSHLVNLRGGGLEQVMKMNRAEIFHSAQDGVLDFVARQTSAFFRALLGSRAAAVVGVVAVAAGIFLLALRKRPAALLLALPFLLGAAAGLAGLYPYGGNRHSSHLLLFAAGAIGVAAAAASRRLWPALLLGIFLGWASWSSRPDPPVRDLAHMSAAIDAIRSNAPAGSLLFGDRHSGLTLSYYLGGSDYFRENPRRLPFWKSGAGGYRLIGSYAWVFNPNRFASELERLIEAYRLPPGQRVWIVHLGREIDPALVLSERFPGAVARKFQFGEIAIVEARLP